MTRGPLVIGKRRRVDLTHLRLVGMGAGLPLCREVEITALLSGYVWRAGLNGPSKSDEY